MIFFFFCTSVNLSWPELNRIFFFQSVDFTFSIDFDGVVTCPFLVVQVNRRLIWTRTFYCRYYKLLLKSDVRYIGINLQSDVC